MPSSRPASGSAPPPSTSTSPRPSSSWPPFANIGGLEKLQVEKGAKYESAREHGMHALRHFYASALLDAGENIKAVSQYLGDSDPGLTLRVYAHLMPSSQERTNKAVDSVLSLDKHVPPQ